MAPDVLPTTSAPRAAAPRRRILLCYDGSAEAKHALALERVGEIASAVPSQVTVVSVAEPIYEQPVYAGFADPSEEHSHRRLLEEASEELRGRGVDSTTAEQVGQPAAAILDAARGGADLVVVGSRHRGLIKRLLFGSVSAELVVEAPCDVLVVR
jgi:nucleotide-binding universal stress UspA family protein